MIAVFLYRSCYDVTMLHCYTFVRTFHWNSFVFFEKLFVFCDDSLRVFVGGEFGSFGV